MNNFSGNHVANNLMIPSNYHSQLSLHDTQVAISFKTCCRST